MKLDFSVFHDLMHPIGSRECRSLPGGVSGHARLWWAYIARPYALSPFYWVACRFGRHRVCQVSRGDGHPWLECEYCPWRQESLWVRQERLRKGEP